MSSRSNRKSSSLAAKAAELSFAAPQVVAHRVARMALAGPSPSARDRKEFAGMVAEKQTAFAQAWQAMALQTMRSQQAIAASWFRAALTPSSWGRPPTSAAQIHSAALGVLGKGLAPVHRKAVANAKRLARTRLR